MCMQTRLKRAIDRIVYGTFIALITTIAVVGIGGNVVTKLMNKERDAVTVVTYQNTTAPVPVLREDCKERGGTDVKFMMYGNPVKNPKFFWTCVK